MPRPDWYCDDVLSGKIDVEKVWEDERVLAFHHPKPTADIHVVVIPKKHIKSILEPEAADGELLMSMVIAPKHDIGYDCLGLGSPHFTLSVLAATHGGSQTCPSAQPNVNFAAVHRTISVWSTKQ